MSEALHCPKCNTELKGDFGYTDCPGCGAVCFIDVDDTVKVKEDEPLNNLDQSSYEEEVHSYEPVEQGESFEEENNEIEYEDPVGESEVVEEEGRLQEEEVVEFSSEENEEPFEEDEAGATDFEEETASENSPQEQESLEPLSASAFLKDLEIFAADSSIKDLNSDLYFDIKITGISKRSELFESLEDSRLDLSLEDLEEGFVEEEAALYLSQVPFVRVVVIQKRILSLGLKMEWLQKEVHDLEPEEESEYEEEADAY